ncbi:MAG: ATP-grasp domain-containing protein [Planctomycetes bacterium]|nr:ATP-grasp domain-containing protein [Planctomycetota bacterium]MCB9904785.1 ATP-grasp domain-containing protein [Planctomycetota bacterium]
MFKKLLIANRGEVAVRIARSARELGVACVGVASESDLGSSWLFAMDEVVPIGGAAPRDSYLDMLRVLQAGVQTACTAVHPGWGFLAENPRFAALAEQHGMTFVGPPASVMARLGTKLPAKAAFEAAGLQGIPGSAHALESVDEALELAQRIGYPVMIKADAGGGGRGIRRCTAADQVRDQFGAARAEAEAAFGDGALFLEKCVDNGRHVEVQVVCDAFGNAIHVGERDCSVQRNHQKLVEETPCPLLSAEERERLGTAAARAAAAIGYVGAGTIEFLRAPSGELYFMEMNARLQVEHPVSEMISGLDLVRLQLQVAANQVLPVRQADVRLEGCAIECRINAEDASDNFRPTPGVLEVYDFPLDVGPGTLRFDTHLAAGDEVPPEYDSLLGKLIAYAPTRAEAIETLLAGLAAARVEGVSTTIPLHRAVLASDDFVSGDYDTSKIPGWSMAGSER